MKRAAAFLRRVIVPSSGGGLILRLVVVVVLVLVVAGPIAWNVSVDHARKRASNTIAQASAAIDEARPAASDGTWEGDQLAKAQTALYEANASYDAGSFFNRGSYGRAKSHAEDALALSTSVTERVKDSLTSAEALAQSGSRSQAISAFFRFYKRYPRTTEAQDALGEAESVLFEMQNNLSTIGQLAAIANFEKHYPLKNIPSKTAAKARSALLEIARTHYSQLKSLASTDRGWVHDMFNKGQTSYDPDTTVSSSDTHELLAAFRLVPALRQPPAMRRVLSLLIAGDRCGERIRVIFQNPYSSTSTSRTFSSGQIGSIGSLSDEIAANLSKEHKLLATL